MISPSGNLQMDIPQLALLNTVVPVRELDTEPKQKC